MIVVDTTVLADFWASDFALKQAAHALLREDPDWIAIGLWRYELGSALSKYVRAGFFDSLHMKSFYSHSAELLVETVDEIDGGRIWDLSSSTGLTFYDAAHVWLAQSRGLRLRTRDKKILRVCPDVAVSMPTLET